MNLLSHTVIYGTQGGIIDSKAIFSGFIPDYISELNFILKWYLFNIAHFAHAFLAGLDTLGEALTYEHLIVIIDKTQEL